MTIKEKVFHIIRDDVSETRLAKLFDNGITWLIMLNVLAIVAHSYDELATTHILFFDIFETISVIIFTLEYGLRLWTADLRYPNKPGYLHAAMAFVFSWMALIDLLALLPFYLPFIFDFELRFLRILRLMRMLRIFKLQRHSKAFQIVREVLAEARPNLVVTLFVTFILMVVASTLMYHLESEVQHDKFTNIGESFWWAVATLTTVGYGDIYPITGWGKLISGIIAVLGIGMVALPTGVISSAFMERMENLKEAKGESETQKIIARIDALEQKIDQLLSVQELQDNLNKKQDEITELRRRLGEL